MLKSKNKGTDYFGYFARSAGYASEAAKLLSDILSAFEHDAFPARVDEMHEIEHGADSVRHEMTELLAREFIPPIEREDIVSLSQELDNVVDAIDEVVRRLYMYDVKAIRPGASEFAALIIRCTDALFAAVSELPSFRTSAELKERLIEVNTLESEGDALHASCLRELFRSETDAKAVLSWAGIFDGLELCMDACEDVADIIENVILKNS